MFLYRLCRHFSKEQFEIHNVKRTLQKMIENDYSIVFIECLENMQHFKTVRDLDLVFQFFSMSSSNNKVNLFNNILQYNGYLTSLEKSIHIGNDAVFAKKIKVEQMISNKFFVNQSVRKF